MVRVYKSQCVKKSIAIFLENMNKTCGYLQSLYDKIRTIPLFFRSPSLYSKGLKLWLIAIVSRFAYT